MGERELVILLLGLAIVAVLLRGLYVAIYARRGQIKLAIDKNIPNDVDLYALEFAELPGGGARVVGRSLEQRKRQNSALGIAETKAGALYLADGDGDSQPPVLMDAVELSPPGAEPEQGIDRPEAGREEFEAASDEAEDDPDAVLFDYEETREPSDAQELNPLSTVAPDYAEETESLDVEEGKTLDEHYFEMSTDEDNEQDSNEDGHPEENNYDEPTEVDTVASQEQQQQTFDPVTAMDEFSMTAGERIGYNAPVVDAAKRSRLFDESDEYREPAVAKPGKSRSLFSVFGAKSSQTEEETETNLMLCLETGSVTVEQSHEDVEADLESREVEQQQAQPSADFVDEPNEADLALAFEEIEKSQQQGDTVEHPEVLVINITAKPGRVFIGDDLLHGLITAGLKFGAMNIFHKRLGKENQSAVIFSVTNMLKPGTFDLNNMEEFTTLGISFFLALPAPINNLNALEQMLDIAQAIRDTLDGEIKDDHRNAMTAQTIEHYRQRVRDFELRRLKAVAARG